MQGPKGQQLRALRRQEEDGFNEVFSEPTEEIAARLIQSRLRGLVHRRKVERKKQEIERPLRTKKRASLANGDASGLSKVKLTCYTIPLHSKASTGLRSLHSPQISFLTTHLITSLTAHSRTLFHNNPCCLALGYK